MGNVRYQLNTPCRDGTTHVVLEPLDFMTRLAALVPRPQVNLTRYHGSCAPDSPWRDAVTPGGEVMRPPGSRVPPGGWGLMSRERESVNTLYPARMPA